MSTPTESAMSAVQPAARHGQSSILHPVVMMLLIMVGAILLTYAIGSGEYQRKGPLVIPGTYRTIAKDAGLASLVRATPARSTATQAYPATIVSLFASIPAGMIRAAPLIFMVMFIGGMFGVLRRTGALDAGIDRLLALTRGNVYWLTPLLMIVICAGSSFLGLISEYLVIIPVIVLLAERIGLGPLFATALVAIAAKLGYVSSVTNPLAVAIAQPIVGVPVFSGLWLRMVVFVVYLAIGIAYLLWYVRKTGFTLPRDIDHARRLSPRQLAILIVLGVSVAGLVLGTRTWDWKSSELAAYYIFLALVIAVISGLPSREAADAFIDGMKGMILGALLIGLASSIEIILRDSLVLDTVIHDLASWVDGKAPTLVAQGMVLIEMVLDVLIPSTSGKAAISMPLLGPIGTLAGVSGQTTVLAFLFGNGLTNMVTPTSGMLLAYLATGGVGYGQWIRFILPLFGVLFVLSMIIMAIAVAIGY
ncbi:MAG: YfcC family protein [Casimicrobiaceae bacterium]